MMPMPTRGGADNVRLTHELGTEAEISRPTVAIWTTLAIHNKVAGARQKPSDKQTTSAADANTPTALAVVSETRPMRGRHSARSAPQTSPAVRVSARKYVATHPWLSYSYARHAVTSKHRPNRPAIRQRGSMRASSSTTTGQIR